MSTSAYQVEGAWNEDGKGESVWDHFAHTPSMIKGGDTGDVACDMYHRYAAELQLMKQMNVRSYRFSVSWPRVRPTGRGAFNQKGLDYYSRLTDAILAQGIRPVCTLFHWDLPQALADPAWRSRETVKLFGEYAAKAGDVLGDRIKTWAILNEPAVFARGAYGLPLDSPEKTSFAAALKSQHGANLATGEAFRALTMRFRCRLLIRRRLLLKITRPRSGITRGRTNGSWSPRSPAAIPRPSWAGSRWMRWASSWAMKRG